VRVGVFVIPASRLRHKKTTGQVLEAIAVSLMMTHGRVETLFLKFKLQT
jgi:hypothetical protein